MSGQLIIIQTCSMMTGLEVPPEQQDGATFEELEALR